MASPTDAHYYLHSGRWLVVFGAVALLWWLVEGVVALMVWVFHIAERYRSQRYG